MNYDDAVKIARDLDNKLRSDDPRLRNAVVVWHDDGSLLYFRYAFADSIDERWVAVYTEHHHCHVFAKSDVRILSTED